MPAVTKPPVVSSTIPVSSIGTPALQVPKLPTMPTTLSTLPPTSATTTVPATNTTGGTAPATPATTAVTPREQMLQNFMDTFAQTSNKESVALDLKTKMGVFEKADAQAKLQQEYDQATVNQRRDIQEMYQNPDGLMKGALDARIQNFKYTSDQNLADKAMALYYAGGDYERTTRMAQEAIDAQFAPLERKMSFFKDMYTLLGNDMTTSEKMQMDSNLRMYESEVNDFRNVKNTALERATTNGAPLEVLKAIKDAGTAQDVWVGAGQYAEDPNLKFAKQKFGAEYALSKSKFDWDREFALAQLSLQQQVDQGVLQQKEADKMVANEESKRILGNSFASIDSALKNTDGFAASTGVVTGGVGGFFKYGLPGAVGGGAVGSFGGPVFAAVGAGAGFLGAGTAGVLAQRQKQGDFANDINYIINNLTTDKLADAKARGITFGALGEKELELVRGSADVIASAWNADTKTFTGSPEKIREAMNKIRDTIHEKQINLEVGKEKASLIDSQFTK